jgi:hypothetical protein
VGVEGFLDPSKISKNPLDVYKGKEACSPIHGISRIEEAAKGDGAVFADKISADPDLGTPADWYPI